jgi:amidophosphoribosyltransferase
MLHHFRKLKIIKNNLQMFNFPKKFPVKNEKDPTQELEELHTECGVFAYYNRKRKLNIDTCVAALTKLQHRGQESVGISYNTINSDQQYIVTTFKGFGFVDEVFKKKNSHFANICTGHVRYSTSGGSRTLDYVQPIGNDKVTIAHNGNISKLPKEYSHDSTFIFDYITKNTHDIVDPNTLNEIVLSNIKHFVRNVSGAYCLVIMTPTKLFAARDRYGIRPLCLGKDTNKTWFIASESVALPDNADRIRDVRPGEIIDFDDTGSLNSHSEYPVQRSHCLFEYIYFLRKDTIADGILVDRFRQKCGRVLAKNEELTFTCEDTIVVGAPHTGISSALEYASCMGLSYKQVLTKTKKRRTFILPDKRDKACDTIYAYSESDIGNKTIILIDDSIVRGNTIKSIAKKFWEYGAKEIHIRVASPEVISQCYFGIDIPTKEELIASNTNCNNEMMIKEMGVTSLMYIKLKDIENIIGLGKGLCSGCFTGKYPDGILDDSKNNLDW